MSEAPTPENDAPQKPWCLCMPGVGPHDDGCPAARVTPPAETEPRR